MLYYKRMSEPPLMIDHWIQLKLMDTKKKAPEITLY